MFWGWLVVVRVVRNGGIAGVVEVVDGSRSFCILILIGKLWLVAIILAKIVLYQSI